MQHFDGMVGMSVKCVKRNKHAARLEADEVPN